METRRRFAANDTGNNGTNNSTTKDSNSNKHSKSSARQLSLPPEPFLERVFFKWMRLVATLVFIAVATPAFYISVLLRPTNFIFRKLGIHSSKFPSNIIIMAWGRGITAVLGGKPVIAGNENVPRDKRTVFMYTHASYFDPILMGAYTPIPAKSIFKKELMYYIPFVFVGAYFAGYIPINRKKKDSAIEALKGAAKLAKKYNRSIVVAPEGTRTTDGNLQPFKKGPFHLAIDAEVEHVIPVVIFNNFELWPIGRIMPRSGTLKVQFCKPVKITKDTTVDSLADDVRDVMEQEIEKQKQRKEKLAIDQGHNGPAIFLLTLVGIVYYVIKYML